MRPDDVRSYSAPRTTFADPTAPRRPAASAGVAPDAGAPAIDYEVPDGWTDAGPSGMRLATLRPGGSGGSEITVIPASGTLEGNAARWQEQLTPGGSADAVARAIEAAEKVPVNGVEATILLLGDEATENPQAILAAMIPLDSARALFVKFKGPAAEARGLREPFTSFVRSLRWK